MKKLLSIWVLSLLLSGSAYANTVNFVCQWNNEGKIEKQKVFFELTEKKLVIDGEEFILSSKPIITDTVISFETIYEDRFWKKSVANTKEELENNVYYSKVNRLNKINKKTGLMVEKQSFINWKNEDTVWISYYECEIF